MSNTNYRKVFKEKNIMKPHVEIKCYKPEVKDYIETAVHLDKTFYTNNMSNSKNGEKTIKDLFCNSPKRLNKTHIVCKVCRKIHEVSYTIIPPKKCKLCSEDKIKRRKEMQRNNKIHMFHGFMQTNQGRKIYESELARLAKSIREEEEEGNVIDLLNTEYTDLETSCDKEV